MNRHLLQQLMPTNAQDGDAARSLVSLGPEEIAPVVPQMLRHLKNLNTPVSDTFAEFFARQGQPFSDQIAPHLNRSTMPEIKWVIVAKILPTWSTDELRPLHGTLGFLMSAPDFMGTDLWCIRLLAKHSLIDQSSLEEWLEFKRNRLKALTNLAAEIAKEMESPNAPGRDA